jgi:hypothetical protein
MKAHEVPDWRIYYAGRLASIQGPNPVGAKPGDLVIHLANTKTPEEGAVAVPVVSPYRLALNISIRSAKAAQVTRKAVVFSPKEKGAKDRVLDLKCMPILFDFFEQCMIAATFAYQAIETYANARIVEELPQGSTFALPRGTSTKDVDAAALQREASTSEKVATVLPHIAKIALSKSSALWQDFVILGQVRDATIHLKAKDHFVRGGKVDRETLFYRLLNNKPPRYPTTALSLMRHFSKGVELAWLDHAEALLKADA